MSVSRMKDGRWYCSFYYKDAFGQSKRRKKEGFRTKREALQYETEQRRRCGGACDMSFESMYALYAQSAAVRLKESTRYTRDRIVRQKILPFFGSVHMDAITPRMIHEWQTQLLNCGYRPTYLRTIHNALAAVCAFAAQYYGLHPNPCTLERRMGRRDAGNMRFWTPEQFAQAAAQIQSEPARMALNLLFWTGIRKGECLALTRDDFDPGAKTLSIRKTLSRIQGKTLITPPKTPRSIRTVLLPDALCSQLQHYISRRYDLKHDDRLFPLNPSSLNQALNRAAARAGIPPIRIHDLRHSHASLLIELGFSPLLVAERLGHESADTTLRIYAHLYPDKQAAAAGQLNAIMGNGTITVRA